MTAADDGPLMEFRRRKIVIVTGSRADFGLLQPVMAAVAEHDALELAAVVAGYHLITDTWRDVAKAGFKIAARVPMQKRDAVGRGADVPAVGRGIGGFGRAFAKLAPDVVVVLGDRIEAFAAASAASIGGYRLAHIHGGDRAEGVADEAMRHAISKLAHIHYPATPTSARRLKRMGEAPAHIQTVGSPAVDAPPTAAAIDAPTLLIVQHPIGASDEQEQRWMAQTLNATADHARLVLAPNGDPGADGIRRALSAANVSPVEHLPRPQWLNLLAGAKAIVGNSSAGLIEAAVLRTPCVNVGPRQAGRERPLHVIDCDYDEAAISMAITHALELDLRRLRHPYGKPGVGRRIADHLATFDIATVPLRKHNTY
ncbi:MAG: UDP-N-acetylglucosamine 2-epimerase [Phycisphaeraceae bacterium]